MAQTIAPIPTSSPIVQLGADGKPAQGYQLNSDYYLWLFALATLVQSSGKLLGTPTTASGQTTSIGTTPLALPALTGGTYRVSFYIRVTTPAGVSSSINITLAWTDGGVACSLSGTAQTGNLATSVLQGSVTIQADAASAISYSTTYASNPGAAMLYKLIVTVEQIA